MAGTRQKVLITGSAGLIAGAVTRELGERYDFTGLDVRRPSDSAVPTLVADLSEYAAMRPAFEGIDAVIHLGADARQDGAWSSILPNNVKATHNVFEACRDAGVRRVVFASSNHAVGMFELDEPYRRIRAGEYEDIDPEAIPQIDHRVPIRPDGDYGISKAFGEATGAYYSENFGLQVACLRIGTVNRENRPTAVRQFATWCSHRDLVQLIERCLSHPGLTFDIFYGVSNNRWRFWDISHARDVLGYEPCDSAEVFRNSDLEV